MTLFLVDEGVDAIVVRSLRGLGYIRIGDEFRDQKVNMITNLVNAHLESLKNTITVVSLTKIKSRPLPDPKT
jgi:hypothetical protein